MFSLSSSRVVVTAMQRNSVKRVLSQRFPRDRLYHGSTTGSSLSALLSFDSRRRDEQSNASVYQRAMPRFIVPAGVSFPQTRWFSSTEAERTYRQRVMDRASHMRHSASASYKDFREHPRESMRSGAKSFSGMMRKYGPVFLGTYAGVYLTTLGSLFACVQTGLLDPAYLFSLFGHIDAGEAKNTVDLVIEWMKNHSITEPYVPFMERNPYLANLAVAWIAVKFTEPIRAAVALAITPRVARTLGYRKAPAEDDEDGVDGHDDAVAGKDVVKPEAAESTATASPTEKKA